MTQLARDFLINKFEQYEKNGSWDNIYQRLLAKSNRQERSLKLTCKAARSIQNARKNRYRDAAPWDHSRIHLHDVPEDESDYINASYVTVPGTERRYILSQGPLENTCHAFWLMCWQVESPGIIMLNKIIEKGHLKCAEYYPSFGGERELEFDPFRVSVVDEQERDNYIIRRIKLRKIATGEEREVYHMQYTEWPDFGCPQSTEHFLELLDDCRRRGILSRTNDDSPPIVHCSAGIGRTGTFIVCDSILHMVESGRDLDVDPEALIVELRKSRMGLIQTAQQLRFCWKAIVDRLKALKEARKQNTDESDDVKEATEQSDTPATVDSVRTAVSFNESNS
ncbi:unnamed protein product, partial [Mesorhabditis belari]|uniref:protein-tyrosine-phosphatase n=1 Tax=Mesorhabditis belari TaxID=2138241 RepID=A0AAF3EZ09_9BILA